MKRTATQQLDESFEYVGEIVKSYVDPETGKRYIVGAASGLEEDKDGERVSKRAISAMVNAVGQGVVKVVAGTHEQNWLTEIGDATEAHIDPETDQLMVKTELPPEGVDPIADKAWAETHKRKMGWSIGGKLRAAYHELTDTGKKRKVLDAIDLRHLCLTDKPAYPHSFAHAVAKTWDGEEPSDEEFTEQVEKDTTTGSWVSGQDGNSGQDSQTGTRNAGMRKKGAKGPDVQDEESKDNEEEDDDEKSLEPSERHLSCPQCGHEFAADIPVDMTPEERSDQEKRKQELEDKTPGEGDKDNNTDDDEDDEKKPPAKKSEEAEMDLEKRIKDLEALVAKQAGEGEKEPEQTPEEVAKAEGVDQSVLKVVALATGDLDERLEKTRAELAEGFQLLGKAVMEIREAVGHLPTGRKSVARVLPPATGHDVEKTDVEKELENAETAVDALKILNAETYGIR